MDISPAELNRLPWPVLDKNGQRAAAFLVIMQHQHIMAFICIRIILSLRHLLFFTSDTQVQTLSIYPQPFQKKHFFKKTNNHSIFQAIRVARSVPHSVIGKYTPNV